MQLPLVVEADHLARHLDHPDLLILDLSSAEHYQQGHIPGAVHVDSARLLCGQPPVPNKLPSAAQLSALFSELGLRADHQVVVYDDQRGALAGRMIWTLHCVGHRRCAFLNGQLGAWRHAALPLEQQPNHASPAPFEARIERDLVADMDYILARLGSAELAIWDARSAAEFRGEKVVNAVKGGHIPGAANFEWTDALLGPGDDRLRPAEQLRAELAARGISADKEVITHCQTHRRSGLTYLVACYLGFPRLRCYDGSWFEWGNQPETPVER